MRKVILGLERTLRECGIELVYEDSHVKDLVFAALGMATELRLGMDEKGGEA